MAMGTHRHHQGRGALFYHTEVGQAPGHLLDRKLTGVLRATVARAGPVVPSDAGGFLQRRASEPPIACWAADSESLCESPGNGFDKATEDHAIVSGTHQLIDAETNQPVFCWGSAHGRAG